MKPNGRDYTTDPVFRRLSNSDHTTLILAHSFQARGPHTEGFDVHDDNEDDGSNQGHISGVSASQAERNDTETVPALATGSAPPPTEVSTATPASGGNVGNVVLIDPQSQEAAEVTQTTNTEGQQQKGIAEAVTEEDGDEDEDTRVAIARSLGATLPTRPRDDDDGDDSPPEHQFKCRVPGCGRGFSEHRELNGTSSSLGIRNQPYSDSIPQPTYANTTINHTNVYTKNVTGHMPLNASGTDMYRFIVSRRTSHYRALILLAGKRRRIVQQRIQPLSPKLRQWGRCHPCSFLLLLLTRCAGGWTRNPVQELHA